MTSPDYATVSLVLAISVCLTGCSDTTPSVPPEPTENPAAASTDDVVPVGTAETTTLSDQNDHDRILGSWRSVLIEKDGQMDPDGEGAKFVFTEDVLNMGGIANWYRMDSSTSPKQLDFNMEGLERPHVGIYQLDGDKLTICFATTVGRPRPTAFNTVPNDGNQLIVCERSPTQLPESTHNDLEPSLRDAIDEAISVLEQNEIEKYLERFVPADELQTMKQSGWEQTVGYVGTQRQAFLNTFRVLPKLTPKMNDARTEAVFDLSQVHINDGVPFPELRLVKIDGNWYMRNR